jgi:hypothetical protein
MNIERGEGFMDIFMKTTAVAIIVFGLNLATPSVALSGQKSNSEGIPGDKMSQRSELSTLAQQYNPADGANGGDAQTGSAGSR